MQHNEYHLEVCLSEIGLLSSSVPYVAVNNMPTPASMIRASVDFIGDSKAVRKKRVAMARKPAAPKIENSFAGAIVDCPTCPNPMALISRIMLNLETWMEY